MSDILVTAALPYINNVPHLGNIIGSHLPADISARYYRLKGENVNFIGGSDAHGTPAMIAAGNLNIPVERLVNALHEEHKRIYAAMGISYDYYSKTSNPIHHRTTVDFFNTLNRNDFIFADKVPLFFCNSEKIALPDRYLVGNCPKCYYDKANADQCDNCSYILNSPSELLDPYCGNCHSDVESRMTTQYFFDLPKISHSLEKWLNSNQNTFSDQVMGEAMGWIKTGLKPRSISRQIPWGIPIPGLSDNVFYVWFDAPIGYQSIVREIDEGLYRDVWMGKDSKIIHFLGKDNIQFHSVWWPGMLLAHGGFNLPSNIVGLQFLNFEGQKFSKSRGIGVFADRIVESGIDMTSLRSYLISLLPESSDSNFTWSGYKDHVNKELIGTLGNLVNRVLSLVEKNYGNALYVKELHDSNSLDSTIISAIASVPSEVGRFMEQGELKKSYDAIMKFAKLGNKYLEDNAPWRLITNSDHARAKQVLALSLAQLRSLAIMTYSFMPDFAEKLWYNLGYDDKLGKPGRWPEASEMILDGDRSLRFTGPIIHKIETEDVNHLREILSNPKPLQEKVG